MCEPFQCVPARSAVLYCSQVGSILSLAITHKQLFLEAFLEPSVICSLPCCCGSLLEWAVPPGVIGGVCAHPPEETGCQAGKRRGTSCCRPFRCLHTWAWEQKEYHLISTSMWPVSAPLRSELCRWCWGVEMTGKMKTGYLCKLSRL